MNTLSTLFKNSIKSQSVIGIGAIILGFAAIGAPFITGILFSILLAVAMCALGVTGLIWLFKEEGTASKVWMGLLSTALIISSFFMFQLPGATLLFSSGVLIAFFVIEGLLSAFYGIKQRKQKGAGWSVFYGILSIACAGLLIVDWPMTGLFAIGTYVGIKLIFLGINVLSLSLVANAVVEEVEEVVEQEMAKEQAASISKEQSYA